MVQGSKKDGSSEILKKEKKIKKDKRAGIIRKGPKYFKPKKAEAKHEISLKESITRVIGQTIEEACASKAMQQEGNKIKLTDLKERGKNRLIDAKKKLIEEEKKRKQRFIVPEKKDDWDDEFDNDLLW